jgi:transposase-like protein
MSRIALVQEQLQQVDELIARLEGSLASDETPRSSMSANIRALEKERRTLQDAFYIAAAQAEMDVYRYRIINSERATIAGLTSAWREFQNMLNAVYTAIKTGGGASKPKTSKKAKSDGALMLSTQSQLELGFGYSFHGSVGIAMTLPKDDAALFRDPVVEQATDQIFEVVASAGNPVALTRIAKRLGPVPVQAVYKWVDVHVAHRFGVGIEWRRDDEHHRAVTVQREEFAILKEELARTTTEATIKGAGDLVIVDSVNREFTIIMDDGQEIVGAYTDAITREHAASVPARYDAEILKSTKVVSVGGEVDAETYMLKKLSPL